MKVTLFHLGGIFSCNPASNNSPRSQPRHSCHVIFYSHLLISRGRKPETDNNQWPCRLEEIVVESCVLLSFLSGPLPHLHSVNSWWLSGVITFIRSRLTFVLVCLSDKENHQRSFYLKKKKKHTSITGHIYTQCLVFMWPPESVLGEAEWVQNWRVEVIWSAECCAEVMLHLPTIIHSCKVTPLLLLSRVHARKASRFVVKEGANIT